MSLFRVCRDEAALVGISEHVQGCASAAPSQERQGAAMKLFCLSVLALILLLVAIALVSGMR
jgi:heme O synthase-like polyprenyltransferase